MSYLTRLLLPLLFLLSASVATADSFTLGQVSVPVQNRTSSAVEEAERNALARLIVQLTGQRSVDGLGVDNLLDTPERWLSQYGFGRADNGSLLLKAQFDVDSLSKALLKAGVPVWSVSRQPLLLWLDTPDGLKMASDSGWLMTPAKQRGLPLILPNGEQAITAADVRGRFMQRMFAASDAYHTDLVATAVIYPGASYQVKWWLYQAEHLIKSGQFSSSSYGDAGRELIQQLTDVIASHYAVQGGQSDYFPLEVGYVNGLKQWVTLTRYLHDLSGVTHVGLDRVSADKVRWKVAFSGTSEQLGRLLDLNHHLTRCDLSKTFDDKVTQDATKKAKVKPVIIPTLQYCWH